MPVIRKKLAPDEVYPADLRYDQDTDTIQSNVNGVWVDNPAGDPRRQTTLPPRLTADPACDAAQSVADAFNGQITGILTAIDNGATAFTIAGFILSIFAFGPFAVFIGLALYVADQMLSAGTVALEAAFSPAVWDTFVCILYCAMDDQGRVDANDMGEINSEINDQIGGLAGAILQGMLQLSGEGGINNLGSLGSSTGFCDDCGCADPCADADSFSAGTVNSVTDNGDGTVTVNVSSVDNGGGVQYVAWGNRSDPGSPCCTFLSFVPTTSFGTPGGAVQACGSSTEVGVFPTGGNCYHYWHYYQDNSLATAFTADVTFESACP